MWSPKCSIWEKGRGSNGKVKKDEGHLDVEQHVAGWHWRVGGKMYPVGDGCHLGQEMQGNLRCIIVMAMM